MTVNELLDTAKEVSRIPSDRALAQVLGKSQAAVWKWRKGIDNPSIENAQALADLAGMNPGEVVASVLLLNAESDRLIKTLRGFLHASIAGIVCILCKMFTQTGQTHPAAGHTTRTSSSRAYSPAPFKRPISPIVGPGSPRDMRSWAI